MKLAMVAATYIIIRPRLGLYMYWATSKYEPIKRPKPYTCFGPALQNVLGSDSGGRRHSGCSRTQAFKPCMLIFPAIGRIYPARTRQELLNPQADTSCPLVRCPSTQKLQVGKSSTGWWARPQGPICSGGGADGRGRGLGSLSAFQRIQFAESAGFTRRGLEVD